MTPETRNQQFWRAIISLVVAGCACCVWVLWRGIEGAAKLLKGG